MTSHVSLRDFVEALRALPPGEPNDPVMMAALRDHRVDPGELHRYVEWNEEHYTRHLVFRDERFQVILLGWDIGQVTPVHDHAGQRCWMLIEDGRLQMSDYCWKQDDGPPRLINHEVVGGDGHELHLDRCACVHRIANLQEWNKRAISLHVYSRPFNECGIYCLESGQKQMTDLYFDSRGPFAEA